VVTAQYPLDQGTLVGGDFVKNSSDTIRFDTRVLLKEVMRRNPTTIQFEESVARAAMAMCRDEVGSCIVLQNNLPVGIITEEDINCKVVARDKKPGAVRVNQVMSTPLITIRSDKTVRDAAHKMIKNKVRRLPVVDDQNKVIGIVTVRDIVTVSTEINELMNDLIEINRTEEVEVGLCSRCGQMSDDLRRIDATNLCPSCREEDLLQ
jgi:predicted transcriptional regulator